jgi:Zn-dependent M28 family amino/carboxypeptidase
VKFWFATAVVLFTCACVSAQTPTDAQSKPATTFDSARAFEHLKRLVEIGPRPAGSPGAEKTRDYIKAEMKALGIEVKEQAFEAKTPIGPVKMVNLRATIPGASNTGRLVIAGHYDTKQFDDITFVGANDAGSSTAFLIEFARVLKDRKNALPIELLFLDGEEAYGEWETGNTFGSRHYVLDASQNAAALKQIKAMILVDMIADKALTFKREENSTPWLTDIIWSTP